MDSYTVWVFFLSILNDVSHAIPYGMYLLFVHFSYFIIITKQKKSVLLHVRIKCVIA